MHLFLAAAFTIVLLASPAYPDDHGFETTSQGMIEALSSKSAPAEPGRTRSWSSIATPGRTIKVVKKEQGKMVEEWVPVYQTEVSPSVNLRIEFDVSSYCIRPDSIKLLNELGKALTSERLRGKVYFVNGHTDSDGSEAYNLILSMNRAQAVKEYLVANHKIQADRLKVVGYGEALPLVPNTTVSNKQLNRRVEVEAVP